MLLRSSPSPLWLKREIEPAASGEAVLTSDVFDAPRLHRLGRALTWHFALNLFDIASEDELDRRNVNFIEQGQGKIPRLLRNITTELDLTFPVPTGGISVLRARRHPQTPLNFKDGTHKDKTTDYRYIIPLIGEGELAVKDPHTHILGQPLEMIPGGVIALNNITDPRNLLFHAAHPSTRFQLMLVYGRSATQEVLTSIASNIQAPISTLDS